MRPSLRRLSKQIRGRVKTNQRVVTGARVKCLHSSACLENKPPSARNHEDLNPLASRLQIPVEPVACSFWKVDGGRCRGLMSIRGGWWGFLPSAELHQNMTWIYDLALVGWKNRTDPEATTWIFLCAGSKPWLKSTNQMAVFLMASELWLRFWVSQCWYKVLGESAILTHSSLQSNWTD